MRLTQTVVNLELSVKHLTENLHLAREKLQETRNRDNLSVMQFSVERKQLEDKIKRLEAEQRTSRDQQFRAKEQFTDAHEAEITSREEEFDRRVGDMQHRFT